MSPYLASSLGYSTGFSAVMVHFGYVNYRSDMGYMTTSTEVQPVEKTVTSADEVQNRFQWNASQFFQ